MTNTVVRIYEINTTITSTTTRRSRKWMKWKCVSLSVYVINAIGRPRQHGVSLPDPVLGRDSRGCLKRKCWYIVDRWLSDLWAAHTRHPRCGQDPAFSGLIIGNMTAAFWARNSYHGNSDIRRRKQQYILYKPEAATSCRETARRTSQWTNLTVTWTVK